MKIIGRFYLTWYESTTGYYDVPQSDCQTAVSLQIYFQIVLCNAHPKVSGAFLRCARISIDAHINQRFDYVCAIWDVWLDALLQTERNLSPTFGWALTISVLLQNMNIDVLECCEWKKISQCYVFHICPFAKSIETVEAVEVFPAPPVILFT